MKYGEPSFSDVAARLLAHVKDRIRRGELSERGLARLTGFSQPHVHHVLKGARGFNAEFADRVIAALGISLPALMVETGPESFADQRPDLFAAPLLEGALGGGGDYPRLGASPRTQWFPRGLVREESAAFAVTLSGAELSMWPTLLPGDLVLLDGAPAVRRRPSFERVYAVCWEGVGYVARCRKVGRRLALVVDHEAAGTVPPAWIDLDGAPVVEVVRGCIVWIGRALR